MSMSLPPDALRAGRRALATGLRAARRFESSAAVMPVTPAVRALGQPAAIRIERTRSGRGDDRSAQTAVTMWFGEGPALPAPGNPAVRGALRMGASVLGAAALAALTTVAAQREARLGAERPRRATARRAGAVAGVVDSVEAPRLTR